MSMSLQVVSEQTAAVGRPVPAPMSGLPRTVFASWRAKRVRLYIEENLEGRLDTESLARVAYSSRAHFCRAFKRTFGVTVHSYIVQRRVERAQHLMLTTSATLADIAAECGMSDHSHLTRLFQRVVEESPSEWRRRNRE